MKKMARRTFLENSTRAAAGSAFLAAGITPVVEGARARPRVSPNDRIAVALIGSGDQGKANLTQFLRAPEVECVAVADVDEQRLESGLSLVESAREKRPDGYRDFRRIIERDDVDAVIGSLARAADRAGMPVGQGCLRGEAAGDHDRGGAGDGGRGPPI